MMDPACHCCPGECSHRVCVQLVDPCATTAEADPCPPIGPPNCSRNVWRLRIYAPDGTLAFDSQDPSDCCPATALAGGCVDTLVWGVGTYIYTADLTRDLSEVGGPSAYAMHFGGSIEVLDECDAPVAPVELEVCEDWLVAGFTGYCAAPPGACSPGVELAVTTSFGGSATVQPGEYCCFTGFGCAVDEFSLAVTAPSPLTGTATFGPYSRCSGPWKTVPFGYLDVTGQIVPAEGFVCAPCCGVPIPRTWHYSDASGLSCDLVYMGSDLGEGEWYGVGGSSSPTAGTYDPYNNCSVDNPGGDCTQEVWATCECGPEGTRFRVRKSVWTAGSAFTPACEDPPPGQMNCGHTGQDSPRYNAAGVSGWFACDPGGASAGGDVECPSPEFNCCPAETQCAFMMTW